ncbi:unnamed protein product, partial [Hapterophycus canaliculatus]
GLHSTARRVNQLMLLKNLTESKTVCEVLIPPPRPPTALATDALEGLLAFRPGELECECKFSRRLPLYHRLRAKKVLDTLAKYTLEGFRVRGRSGLYVCPDRVGNFFYMTLSEVRSPLSLN